MDRTRLSTRRNQPGNLRQWGRSGGRYVVGAVLGAVGVTAIAGLILVTVMHYANDIFGFDIKESVASIVLGIVLLSPLIGLTAGIVIVRRRERRRSGRVSQPLKRAASSEPPVASPSL